MHENPETLTAGTPARWKTAAAVFIVVASAIALATVHQYGATWDEEHSMRQGDLVIRWYTSGLHDRRVIDEGNFRLYGGFFNVLVQLAHRAGAPLYEASHTFTVLFGLSSLPIAYWIGSTLSSPLGGFLSAVFLWMTPLYYGHSFNNPKDLPFAVMSLASFAAILACWRHLPNPPARIWLRTAVVLGLTLAIRVAGILVFGYLALSWLAWLAIRAYPFDRERLDRLVTDALRLAGAGAKIFAVAWLIMCVFWPWAQVAPVHGPWRGLYASRHFGEWVATVRFAGADVFSDKLPRSYVPLWFGVTLPEFYLVAAALACVVLFWTAKGLGPSSIDRTAGVFLPLLALTAAFPVAGVVWSRPILYDGIRHLLFVVPTLAILAAVAVAYFFSAAESRWARAAVAVVLTASVVLTAIDMWRLHPYESVYFNRTVGGGFNGAFGRFETDYWGQSYKEAVEWLVTNYKPAGPGRTRVANCNTPFLTGYYLEKEPDLLARFESVAIDQAPAPDIVLATTRWGCPEKIAGRVLHVVKRLDTPLCYVIEVDAARFSAPVLGQ